MIAEETIRVEKTLRRKLRESKYRLKIRLARLERCLAGRNEYSEEAAFWWAKIMRRINSIRKLCEEIIDEPDKENDLRTPDYTLNAIHAHDSLNWLEMAEAGVASYTPLFKEVPLDFGMGFGTYQLFKLRQ